MRHLRIWIFTGFILSAALFAQDAGPAPVPPPPAIPHYTAVKSATLSELFLRGGYLMGPILLALLAGLALGVERLINLRLRIHSPKDFSKDIVHVVDTRGVDAGLALCLEKQSSLGRALYAALLRYGTSRQEMEYAVTDEGKRVLYDLLRNTRPLAMLLLITPLLGIAGAGLSLLECFDRMAVLRPETSEQLLYAGAASALLPLVFGLSATVLLCLVYFHVKAKAGDIARDIDEQAIQAVVTLDRKARQSIRLIEDIEEQTKTKDMQALKALPPDLAREIEIDRSQGSGIKSSITTHAGLQAQKLPEDKK